MLNRGLNHGSFLSLIKFFWIKIHSKLCDFQKMRSGECSVHILRGPWIIKPWPQFAVWPEYQSVQSSGPWSAPCTIHVPFFEKMMKMEIHLTEGPFNNYLARWEVEGVKKCFFFCTHSGYKNCPRRGGGQMAKFCPHRYWMTPDLQRRNRKYQA